MEYLHGMRICVLFVPHNYLIPEEHGTYQFYLVVMTRVTNVFDTPLMYMFNVISFLAFK